MSVRTGLPSPTAGSIKEFSAALAVVSTKQVVLVLKGSLLNRGLWYILFLLQAQSSAVETWQVMLQQEGQQSEVMSAEDAATLGYFIMFTPGRLVFRTTFGQRHASVKMVWWLMSSN